MSNAPNEDDAGAAGGDIPARPIGPDANGGGTGPRHEADGPHAHIPTEAEADETEAHPT